MAFRSIRKKTEDVPKFERPILSQSRQQDKSLHGNSKSSNNLPLSQNYFPDEEIALIENKLSKSVKSSMEALPQPAQLQPPI